jgi:CHAD domain-containing protein
MEILADYVSAKVTAMRAHTARARDGDPEAVHDMRVAVRRLRSTLKTFGPLLPEADVEPVRADLQWLGTALGRVRDAQVMSDRLIAAVAAEPAELVVGPIALRVRTTLEAEVAQALDSLRGELDRPRFAAALDALDRLAQTDPAQTDLAQTDPAQTNVAGHHPLPEIRRLARKALRRADRKLAAATAADTADRDAMLHDARRAYKRARYAVETLQPTAGRPAARLVQRLTAVQDVLGSHHDTIVTRQHIRDLGLQARLDGENEFTYGLLHARQHEAASRELAALGRIARRAQRRSTRAWLSDRAPVGV